MHYYVKRMASRPFSDVDCIKSTLFNHISENLSANICDIIYAMQVKCCGNIKMNFLNVKKKKQSVKNRLDATRCDAK